MRARAAAVTRKTRTRRTTDTPEVLRPSAMRLKNTIMKSILFHLRAAATMRAAIKAATINDKRRRLRVAATMPGSERVAGAAAPFSRQRARGRAATDPHDDASDDGAARG